MLEDRRHIARQLMEQFRYAEAKPIIEGVLAQAPDDPEMTLALAIVLDKEFGLAHSRSVYERAVALNPDRAMALVNFGFALHRDGLLVEAKHRFFEASTVDRDCDSGYTGLAICQRDLGEYEKAEKNLRSGLMAMGRVMGKYARRSNSKESPMYSQRSLGAELWMQTAVFGAMFLMAEDGISNIEMPTDESAKFELTHRRYGGLYFEDRREGDQSIRRYLPNFFDSVREWLVDSPTYPGACQTMGEVLAHLGNEEEAADYFFEAESFEGATPLAPSFLAGPDRRM